MKLNLYLSHNNTFGLTKKNDLTTTEIITFNITNDYAEITLTKKDFKALKKFLKNNIKSKFHYKTIITLKNNKLSFKQLDYSSFELDNNTELQPKTALLEFNVNNNNNAETYINAEYLYLLLKQYKLKDIQEFKILIKTEFPLVIKVNSDYMTIAPIIDYDN